MGGDVARPALVLVTGAAGFIGSRFVQFCVQKGLAVVSVDKASHFESRPEHKGVAFGRIVDRGDLFAWLDREKPRLSGIVHLGACTDTTELNEAYLTEINVEYSRKLWRYATRERVPFVYASSAATYGGKFNQQCRHIRAREIGMRLNMMGGSSLMRKVYDRVDCSNVRQLAAAWDEIGDWVA